MAYITSDGRVMESRPWSFGSIPDFFWGIINFFALFFRTLINPNETSKVCKLYMYQMEIHLGGYVIEPKVPENYDFYTLHVIFYRAMDILQTIDQREEEVLHQAVVHVDDLEDLDHLVGAALLLPCQEEVDEVKQGVRK